MVLEQSGFSPSGPSEDSRVYWIWLQETLGPGSPLPGFIGREFPGGAVGFYKAGPPAWDALPDLRPWQRNALVSVSLDMARKRLNQAARLGFFPLTPEDPRYPELLRHIYAPPAVLYVRGLWPDFSAAPAISVIGARHARAESCSAARRIAGRLAKAGVIVVTGTARGVDASVLTEAIQESEHVISVLPSIVDNPYLAASFDLHQKLLLAGGALVSECFIDRHSAREAFQLRNRIITGLCQGVVLIQAALRSGTIQYANHALEQGREVWVYPGAPEDPAYEGSRLLLEEGAEPVWNGQDVLNRCPGWPLASWQG